MKNPIFFVLLTLSTLAMLPTLDHHVSDIFSASSNKQRLLIVTKTQLKASILYILPSLMKIFDLSLQVTINCWLSNFKSMTTVGKFSFPHKNDQNTFRY